MTQELAVGGQSIALRPQDVVTNATQQAKLLMGIVDQTKCFQLISGKKYLQVEAWETIGAFNRVHAVTESITPIMRDDELVGYDAKVNLVNVDGLTVGGAIMPCYFTENACKGKIGDAKDKASKSAAQTFATSKAYRMNYSYVAILAGYEPTPAEEMVGSEPAQPERMCPIHNVPFAKFTKGTSSWWSHAQDDGWCNEAKVKKEVEIDSSEPPPQEIPDLKNLPIMNLGDLFTATKSHYGMSQAAVLKEVGLNDKSQIADPQETWVKIVTKFESKGKEDITE